MTMVAGSLWKDAVESFVLSEPQWLVTTLKTTLVAAEIANLKDQTLSSVQKFEQALAIAAPLIVQYVAAGPSAIVTDAEGVARELVQSLYNDMVNAAKAAVTPAAAPAG